MTDTADAIIIGGGVMGVSAAYQLARRGLQHVRLLERDLLCGGSTAYAGGGIRHQFSDPVGVELTRRSLAAFERTGDELGVRLKIERRGYAYLISNERQRAAFGRNVAMQQGLGVEVYLLDQAETARLFPYLQTDDLLGASYTPNDTYADALTYTRALAARAEQLGVRLQPACEVYGVRREAERVVGVETSLGPIDAPTVVIAAGPWSALVGHLAGVDIPVQPRRREQYLTAPVPLAVLPETPYLLDQAGGFSVRRHGEGVMFGHTRPIEPTFDTTPNPDFGPGLQEQVARRCPAAASAPIVHAEAGLLEVTPDHNGIISAVPNVAGLYVLTGFSGHGFMHAPAAGELLAELIVDGQVQSLDLAGFSLDRFARGELQQDATSPFH
jgi:sarcosine oxidase subunit beta